VVVEVAEVAVGSSHLSIRALLENEGGGAVGDTDRAATLPGMPEIDAQGSRFLLRGTGVASELTAPQSRAENADEAYRVDPPTGFDEARRRGSGDDIEWTLRGREGLERVLRVAHPGGARWRVTLVREPGSGATASVEYDSSDRLTRITGSNRLEWALEYERPSAGTAPRLVQVTGRTSANAGSEMLYRARLDYRVDAAGGARLERVRAASRSPAGVVELAFVYGRPEVSTSGTAAPERLREVLTKRGHVDPRFEYDVDTAAAVFSAVPREDANDARYPVTAQLQPEYVGDDLLEDALGRRTLEFDDGMRESHRLQVRDGLLLKADGTPLDTGDTTFLIVLAPDGELYAAEGDYSSPIKIHHSSILAGAPVASAGEIAVRAGKVLRVTSRSGHYKPPMCLLDQLRAELKQRGVALDGVPFEKGY